MLPVLLVHGGVGSTVPKKADADSRLNAVRNAVLAGHQALLNGGNAIDGVETAVNVMEESGVLNAGRGAVTQADGQQRMDATIMMGDLFMAGAVASLRGILHPISVARKIMEETPHVMLAHDFAKELALQWGIPVLPDSPNSDNVPSSPAGETVGAVALDQDGHLAAGTSTGGLQGTAPGRIGDTAIIGAGTFANTYGAASATGIGENIIKLGITRLVVSFLEFEHTPAQAAIDRGLEYYQTFTDTTLGMIVLGREGEWGVGFLGGLMPWAVVTPASKTDYELQCGVDRRSSIRQRISPE
ncbi:MAG TPA: isoaspartyl peptidase/L-asparaginase family protein [Candidatus Lokiarchaeia archaeon]|nr:isoaspartyl peptidase/L-asparaginase family protein [Candidatus Lokiarchaeia archaeon]